MKLVKEVVADLLTMDPESECRVYLGASDKPREITHILDLAPMKVVEIMAPAD